MEGNQTGVTESSDGDIEKLSDGNCCSGKYKFGPVFTTESPVAQW